MLYIVPEVRISPSASQDLVESLLRLISEGKTLKLKNLSEVEESGTVAQLSPELLAGAAMKLESLCADLTSPLMKAILTRITGTPDSKLKKLYSPSPSPADLSGIDPDIMSEALVKLETVEGLKLSPDQVLSVLSKIRDTPNLRLTDLDLTDTNVSLVPPEVFAGAVSRLESLWSDRVTKGQLESLSRTLISHRAQAGEPKLKKLGVFGGDLSSFSPEVLVGTIQRLEVVGFCGNLTEVQITAILLMLKRKQQGRLKLLMIHYPGVSVSQTLLQEAQMNNAVRIIVSI